MSYTGSCLCGRIRFKLDAEASFPHLCSCTQCQRWSGAPVLGWADFPRAALVFEGAEPRYFRSSAGTQRGFCEVCGSSLVALDDDSEWVSVTLSCLPGLETLSLASHSFAHQTPPWFPQLTKKS